MGKRDAIKTKKMCVVCGGEFLGTNGKMTCDARCRNALARIKAAKKRPEFISIVKGRGQKIPDLNAPKGLKFKKGEKKIAVQNLNEQSKGTTQDLNKLPEQQNTVIEVLPEQKELTKEQKLAKSMELEKELKSVRNKTAPLGVHPKTFALMQDDVIKDLETQIKALTNG